MRQSARFCLIAAVLSFCVVSSIAQTTTAIFTVSNFVSRAVNVQRLTITPLLPGPGFQNGFLSPYIPPFTRANTPSLTNGTVTVTNLIMDYAYTVAISDGYTNFTAQIYPDSRLIGTNATIYAANYVSRSSNPYGPNAIPYLPCFTSVIVSNITYLHSNVTNDQVLTGIPSSTNGNFTGTVNATGGNVVTNLQQSVNFGFGRIVISDAGMEYIVGDSIINLLNGSAIGAGYDVALGTDGSASFASGAATVDNTGKIRATRYQGSDSFNGGIRIHSNIIGLVDESGVEQGNLQPGNAQASFPGWEFDIGTLVATSIVGPGSRLTGVLTNDTTGNAATATKATTASTATNLAATSVTLNLSGLTGAGSLTTGGALTLGITNAGGSGIAANSSATNLTLYATDQNNSNQVSVIGNLRATEGVGIDNVNVKPYIAFASEVNLMSTGQCTCIVLGDSMSGLNYYNSMSKHLIWMLQNNYGWVGDYGFIADQLGVSMNLNNFYTNYWFGVGGVGVKTNDSGSGSWTQGVQNGGATHFTTRTWQANKASLLYIKQPLGGTSPWQCIMYGDGRSSDYRPTSFGTPGLSINTFSATTNAAVTSWPIPLNYYQGAYQSIRENYTGASGATGTNVFIGAGFENTNATGLRTYWFGDNGAIGGGGSVTLPEMLSVGTNILHSVASVIKPDFIIYHAKDFGEGGSTNISQIQSNLTVLLSTNFGLAWTNTKIFVIATPGRAFQQNNTTSNNAALRLAAEANNWSYINLCDDYSDQLYGTYPATIGADPMVPGSGIIADSVHPSDWGAWLMAYRILTKELGVPIRYEPNSKYNGVMMGYQQYPFVNSVDNNWGVPTPSLALQSAASPDVRPFVMSGGTTNLTEVNALNYLCARLRQNNLWPNGTNKTLILWPMVGATERTCRFNLIDPGINYLNPTAGNDACPTNGFAYVTLGIQPTNAWVENYRNSGIYTGVREENVSIASPVANGPNGSSDSVQNNPIFNYTNTCIFLGLVRTSTNNPAKEGFWKTGNTLGTSVIQNGEWDVWYGGGFLNVGYPSVPIAGVVGWCVTNGTCCVYTNGILKGSPIAGSPVSSTAYESTFCQGSSGYGAGWSLNTNAIVFCAGYGCGYSQTEFTNLQAIINQFGIDKTNPVINRNLVRW